MKKKKPSKALILFAKITGYPMCLLFFKPKVYYESETCSRSLPKPCILMSNHKSLMDFVLYFAVFVRRNIRFLMAEVLFRKNKLFSALLYGLGGIYVNRDACDLSFIADSLEELDAGGIVGIFPEGRLPVKGQAFPFKPGIVLLASKTDAPIIPVCTAGGYGLFKRAHVMIGEAIDFNHYCTNPNPTPEEAARLTGMLEERMRALEVKLQERITKKA